MFIATPAEMSRRPVCSGGSYVGFLVDSAATNKYLGPELTPEVRSHICDVEDLQLPHTVVAAGQIHLKGITSGTIVGDVTDDNGNDRRVSFRVVSLPDLGTIFISVTVAMQE